jgi:hypothetical protein
VPVPRESYDLITPFPTACGKSSSAGDFKVLDDLIPARGNRFFKPVVIPVPSNRALEGGKVNELRWLGD